MKKVVMIIGFLSLVRLWNMYEAVTLGEAIKFGKNTYVVTGGISRGLTTFSDIEILDNIGLN